MSLGSYLAKIGGRAFPKPLRWTWFGSALLTTVNKNDTIVFSILPNDINGKIPSREGPITWKQVKLFLKDTHGILSEIELTNGMDASISAKLDLTATYYGAHNTNSNATTDPYVNRQRIVFSQSIKAGQKWAIEY